MAQGVRGRLPLPLLLLVFLLVVVAVSGKLTQGSSCCSPASTDVLLCRRCSRRLAVGCSTIDAQTVKVAVHKGAPGLESIPSPHE
eukprot:1159741-Pelagomonas_calceolata.AAC.19